MTPHAVPAAAYGPAPNRAVTLLLCLTMGTWLASFMPNPEVLGTFPAMVAFLVLVERCRRTRHAIGWIVLFGAVGIGSGYSWLAKTVRDFGELDEKLGAFAVPASWLVLAVYGVAGTIHGILFAILHRLSIRPTKRPHPLFTVALFVACETLPIRFLPWMAGYGAVDVAPLRQVAEWGGVAGVSFALLCLVVPLHELLRWAFSSPGAPARPVAAVVTMAVGLVAYGVGFARYRTVVEEDRVAKDHVRVAIVQANVGSQAKRLAEQQESEKAERNWKAYKEWTEKAVAAGPELVVWPETALVDGVRIWNAASGEPFSPATVSRNLRQAGYGFLEALGKDRTLLLGGYEDEGEGKDTVRYNAAMLREPGGTAWSVYRKTRLLPFGETMPLQGLFPGLRDMLPQRFPMAAGPVPQPPLTWRARKLKVGAFICYESILPSVVLDVVGPTRPDLLVNLTNDSWYGDTWEPRQHLNFSRFRAVEHRAPLVRATNTGISAFIDAAGDVLERTGYDVPAILVRDVPLVARDRTLFATYGHLFDKLLWILAGLGLLWTRLRR